ncbi:MAG: hypothetical protein ACU0CQ_11695, partial [Sulfitobacter sp.]|uniref:hypothetical protein n=1 Tax=Sulfitobacter sp. TaxID=1903071 RepID=UPI0040582443
MPFEHRRVRRQGPERAAVVDLICRRFLGAERIRVAEVLRCRERFGDGCTLFRILARRYVTQGVWIK